MRPLLILALAALCSFAERAAAQTESDPNIATPTPEQATSIATPTAEQATNIATPTAEQATSEATADDDLANLTMPSVERVVVEEERYERSSISAEEAETVWLRVFVIAQAALVAGGVVYLRRKRKLSNKRRNAELRRNIQKLRDERLILSPDRRKSALRAGLTLEDPRTNKKARGLVGRAKRLEIGVGEAQLATKLRAMSGARTQ
jgi:hypothetical protein